MMSQGVIVNGIFPQTPTIKQEYEFLKAYGNENKKIVFKRHIIYVSNTYNSEKKNFLQSYDTILPFDFPRKENQKNSVVHFFLFR
jgi:hypothetical protein